MDTNLPKLELQKVLQQDAEEIVASRIKASLIHATRDINAAGDEVEKSVRNVIRRKLATRYYLGHGHIIDADLSTSPQFDAIIADNSGTPILFKTENETEYFPYEAVYAVGEIKSTYYKSKNYVSYFCDSMAQIKSQLNRENTPLGYIRSGFNLENGFTVTAKNNKPYSNPLFSFMFFVDSGDFEVSHIIDLYKSRPIDHLPNILCFLNKGIVVNMNFIQRHEQNYELSINVNPEFNVNAGLKTTSRWFFIPFGTEENRLGANLGYLIFTLSSHLRHCVLMPPDLSAYLNRFFVVKTEDVIVITE